jgi:anthranilate phosphoribosyltransferase
VRSILEKYSDRFSSGKDLQVGEGEEILDALIRETDEALLANVLRAWDEKGIGEDEIFAIARVLRERCTRVVTRHETFVDIVGTGGSMAKTFNVSTAAAFVVAGAGVPVAKHGNRAATSNSGSADVLAALGVEPAVDAETAGRCLDEIGICFMFAPNFHRLSPTLGKVRRGLGFPTIFNCVGPLCNPAEAPHQLIGVWSHEMVSKMANALARLGTKRSWVVNSDTGLDEIAIDGNTTIAEVDDGRVKTYQISLANFGIHGREIDDIRTGSVEDSASLVRDVLAGRRRDHAAETIVCQNSAAALYLTGRASDLAHGFETARESVRSGSGEIKLRELATAVNNR